jgi:hypothetical protein
MKKTLVKGLVLTAFGMSMVAGNAAAMSILDFEIGAPTPGTFAYAGGANPLLGTGIQVDSIVGLDTLLNGNNSYRIIGGELNFTTGASTGEWQWGGGAESGITLVGGVDVNNDNIADFSGTLLSGIFGTTQITHHGHSFHITGASFTDSILPELLDFYGLPQVMADGITPLSYDGNFNISFIAPYTSNGAAFSSQMLLHGDLVNTASLDTGTGPAAVPAPASMLLLGAGLVGLLAIPGRRSCKQATKAC